MQEPLDSALAEAGGGGGGADAAANPFAALFQPPDGGEPNEAPLPNPWAAPAAGGGGGGDGGAGAGLADLGGLSLGGGAGGMAGLMGSPDVQAAMQGMMNNPQVWGVR